MQEETPSTIAFTDKFTPNSIQYAPVKSPEYSWEMQIGNTKGIVVMFEEKDVPNWFHHKMQELILGFKWRKLK